MKKVFSIFCSLLIGLTLASCNNNANNEYYIKTKNEAGGEFEEAKKLADKINDLDVEKEIGISINQEKTSLNADTKVIETDDGYNIPNNMFRSYNGDIIENSFYSLNDALEECKMVENIWFEYPILILNNWNIWGDGSGQNRLVFDEKTNYLQYEVNYLKEDKIWNYGKYQTYYNENNNLTILNKYVEYNKTTDFVYYQREFKYVENESFDFYFYDNTRMSNYTITGTEESLNCLVKYYNIEHADLSPDNKSYTRFNNYSYYYDGKFVGEKIYYNNQIYLDKYMINDRTEIIDGVTKKYTDICDYNCINILTAHEDKSADIYFNYLDGFTNIIYKNQDEKKIYNGEEEIILSSEYCGWSIYAIEENDKPVNEGKFLGSIWMNGNHKYKEWKDYLSSVGLTIKNNHDLFEIEKLVKKYQKTYKKNDSDKELRNFKFYDKAYREESMKENKYPIKYTHNNVESEIEGDVVLKDNILDLTNFKITVDKAHLFEDGEKYEFQLAIMFENNEETIIPMVTLPDILCDNGKVVFDKLITYDLSRFKEIQENKKIRLMLRSKPKGDQLKLFICDIEMDNSTGTLNGKPIPISYEAVEWQ